MKKYQIIIAFFLFMNHCKAQTGQEKLLGTWEETHRDYVYFKTDMAYDFTQIEKKVFKGSKIAFEKNTMYAYVTYLLENTMSPISYEIRDIKTDTVNLNHGNLSELLQKKGKYCKEITVKKKAYNGYKEYYDEYGFYLFEDGSLAFLEDYSLHYFNKISDKNIGKWDTNEYGQTIIRGVEWGNFEILINNNYSNLIITYIPQNRGENYFSVKKMDNNSYQNICKIKSKSEYKTKIVVFKSSKLGNKIQLSIGNPLNPIESKWEVRYKFIDDARKIGSSKAIINSNPDQPTKMYLIKGDAVEVLEQKESWLKIRYYGKKTIDGWIKKEDVEK